MSKEKYELVKFVDNGFELEVNVSPTEDTVWLDAESMADLFSVNRPAIVKHTNNIIKTGELEESSCSILEQVQIEGERTVRRKVKMFNLDMIIAVGYRVNSKRGTLFRRWANSVLRQYLIKGYAMDQSRVMVTQENYLNLVSVVTDMKSSQLKLEDRVEKLEEKHPDVGNRIFFQGQMWDATSCIERIISGAKESVILIDNYVDRITLDMLSRKKKGVEVILYTSERHCSLSGKEIDDFRTQYGPLSIRYTDEFHERFLILDREELYHIGASIKDAGKKAFAITTDQDERILKSILERL